MTFGDWEPEDSWHPDDPVLELLENLTQRCALLRHPVELPEGADPEDWLTEIRRRVGKAKMRHLTVREQVRVRDLDRHVHHVHIRIMGGLLDSQHG